ncbi:Protein Wfdc11, partial [Manis pentadactyla]
SSSVNSNRAGGQEPGVHIVTPRCSSELRTRPANHQAPWATQTPQHVPDSAWR